MFVDEAYRVDNHFVLEQSVSVAFEGGDFLLVCLLAYRLHQRIVFSLESGKVEQVSDSQAGATRLGAVGRPDSSLRSSDALVPFLPFCV